MSRQPAAIAAMDPPEASGSGTSGPRSREAKNEAAQQNTTEGDRDTAYFQYYALLSHQAQMLQDNVRTSVYQRAILSNGKSCFQDKLVIDVGAGNGILSLFSAQAGAKRVYAIEASQMAQRLQHLLGLDTAGATEMGGTKARASSTSTSSLQAANGWIGGRVLPVQAKMEDVTPAMLEGNEKVDTIVSECLGVLLVHERMCESFLDARDRFLKPGGTMVPSSGTICLAPIEDKIVWDEAANKARFWDNQNFYGVDITPLSEAAWKESFSSPVVGCFGPSVVLAPSNDYMVDFQTISQDDLRRFTMPLSFEIDNAAVVHGLAGWFDLHFLANATSSDKDADITDAEMATSTDPGGATNGLAHDQVLATQDLDDVGSLLRASGVSDFVPGAGTNAMSSSSSSSYMSTSPFATPTHWQQVRFLFRDPLAVNKGQQIVGQMHCEVNENRSYTLTAQIGIAGTTDPATQRHLQWRLDRQVYSWTSAAPAPQ